MRKNAKLSVGDRVATFINEWDGTISTKIVIKEDCGPEYGTVTEILGGGLVAVKWDSFDGFAVSPDMSPIEINKLMFEEEMKKEYASLEAEFSSVEKDITKKMKEAGVLIKEASKLAKKQGFELVDMYDAVNPLYDAMDACGWRTSSFFC